MSERPLSPPAASWYAELPAASWYAELQKRPRLVALAGFIVFFALYFSPATLTGHWLAPGDGLISYFPSIYRDWSLWSPNIYSGYPSMADPQALMWYPLRYLAPDYNWLVISAYVAAGFFTFCFAYARLTSFWPAMLAAIVYSSGGFMMAHLGHLTIIHAAAWLPLILWSLDELSRKVRMRWIVAGAMGVALSFLGGHPQIFLYSAIFAGTFGVWRLIQVWLQRGWRPALAVKLAFGATLFLGLMLACIQVMPLLEFRELSSRSATWTFKDFSTFSLPLDQLSMLTFPYIFGGGIGLPGYLGKWNLTELTVYAGLGALALALMGLAARRKSDETLFWLAAAVVGILVATSGSTLLGPVLFKLPVIGDFRATARAGLIYAMSIAMLSGAGLSALQRGAIKPRTIWALAVATLLAALALFAWKQQSAIDAGGDIAPFMLSLRSGGYQLIGLVVVIGIVVAARRLPRPALGTLVTAITMIELASFGQFYEWRVASPTMLITEKKPDFDTLAQDLANESGRVLPLFNPEIAVFPMTTALNDYYRLPSAGGYGPLMPGAYAKLMGFQVDMRFSAEPGPQVLKAAGISRIAYEPAPSAPLILGGCGAATGRRIEVKLGQPILARRVRITSNMGCSIELVDGRDVLVFEAGHQDESFTYALQAGRDTSEWAIDRPDVAAIVKHSRAPIAGSFDGGDNSLGHTYAAEFELPATLSGEVDRIALTFPAKLGAGVTVQAIEFIGQDGAMTPIDLTDFRRRGEYGLEPYQTLDNGVELGRTSGFAGPAWLAQRTVHAAEPDAIAIVRNAVLPDGSEFDAAQTAIVNAALGEGVSGKGGTVTVAKRNADRWALDVEADGPGYLVISQSWHPGWKATVNGQRVAVIRTNAAFQGMAVPDGKSRIELTFAPTSLRIGGAITALGLVVCAGLMLWPYLRRWKSTAAAADLTTPSPT